MVRVVIRRLMLAAIAASLVMAEVLRMLHEGERYDAIDLRLSSPAGVRAGRAPERDCARCSSGRTS